MRQFAIFTVALSLVGLPLGAALAQQPASQQPAGQQPYGTGGAQDTMQREQTPRDQTGQTGAPADQAAALVDVNSLIGAQVRDSQGREMGKIDRLMADPRDGQLRYALIATGGFLGVGRDHVQVPWQDLQIQRDGQNVVVTMERQALEQAPAAKRDDATSPAASPRTTPDSTTPGATTQPGSGQPAAPPKR
ncbi:MAG TPA: PRC-barrel domain-containing protein [Methylomirabilota bacterium]